MMSQAERLREQVQALVLLPLVDGCKTTGRRSYHEFRNHKQVWRGEAAAKDSEYEIRMVRSVAP